MSCFLDLTFLAPLKTGQPVTANAFLEMQEIVENIVPIILQMIPFNTQDLEI